MSPDTNTPSPAASLVLITGASSGIGQALAYAKALLVTAKVYHEAPTIWLLPGDIKERVGGGLFATKQRVAQAASIARLCGKMPAELERLVTEILDPVVPWPEVLREYMTRTSQDDESWARRNRRYNAVCLPRRYSQRLDEIIFIGDTSGSIGNDALAQGVAEVRSVAEQMRPERIRIVWADAAVAGEQVFELHDEIIAEPKGGGGTDMTVPLHYVEQFNPPVVVLMTDGYTPWPAVEPPYPLIVLCTTDAPCPVGQVIRVRG